MPDHDQSLIARCQAGDKSAFEQLVRTYQGRAYAVAYGMLGSRDDAMDAVQETFVKAYRNLDGFRRRSGFYTWLYRILTNVCIDLIRKRKKANTVDYEEGMPRSDTETPDSARAIRPDERQIRASLRETIERAMQTLSPTQRAVILMREVEGMSYSEMADAMACSQGTIMSRLFHARRKLAQTLEPLVDEDA